MFERILLPLDGSEIAEKSLLYAEEIASKFGSEIILFHARGYLSSENEHIRQTYLDGLVEVIKSNLQKNDAEGVKVTSIIQEGEPAQNICNWVVQNKIDLIIMTFISLSGLKIGKMLGTVADHVCRNVPIPVMLVKPQNIPSISHLDKLISNILIPLDGSELSKRALPIGEKLGSRLKAQITLFQMARMIYPHVAVNYDGIIDYGKFGEWQEQNVEQPKFNEREVQIVHEEMIVVEAELKEKGLNVTHTVQSGTDAANEIIEISKEVNADLVIMATHGRYGLDRLILGSVTEKVLWYGKTPLLLVNARAV